MSELKPRIKENGIDYILDVYKRQTLCCENLRVPLRNVLIYILYNLGQKKIPLGTKGRTSIPVSYTHLEAIKHQGFRTSGQIDPKDAGKRSNEIVAERNKMAVKQYSSAYGE